MEFGPFDTVFARGELRGPAHLALLNVSKRDRTRTVLARVEAALGRDGAGPGLQRLLQGANWRRHLVGAVAVWMLRDPQPFLPFVWTAVREGSWVTPQLLAVAADRDPDFDGIAGERLQARCPVRRGTGPLLPSAKEASAIVAIAAGRPWLQALMDDPELAALLDVDGDDGGGIAAKWERGVRSLLDERGLRGTVLLKV